MNVPEDLRYSTDHEWARLEGTRVRVGITDYAQSQLGDVVFSEIESMKSVSEIYAPLDGAIVEVNGELADVPQKINEDPYGEGWICVIEPTDSAAYDALLDATGYRNHVDS